VSQVRRFSPWVLGMLAAAPLTPAFGQNLDAGKPASQIFAEACATCHRSPRELRRNPGVSFLREHYTTGSDMASTMAAYLASAGGESRGAGAPQPKRAPAASASRDASATDPSPQSKRPPNPVGPAAARNAPALDPSPDPRRAQQNRPGTTRADGTAEAKTPAPPTPSAPSRPVLEEFEE
jgi:hypothetical protein